MNMFIRLLSIAVSLASLRAQCSTSPFIAVPTSVSFAEGVGAAPSGGELFHKQTGFAPGLPQPWSGATPVFSWEADRRCSLWSLVAELPDMDATSIGEDWVMADENGRMLVPYGSWGALSFSVTRDSRGVEGSVLASERGQIGADVFTYVLPGSEGVLPPEIVGQVSRAVDQSELTAFADGDVDGLDHHTWLFRSAPFLRAAMLSPVEWYFSVTSRTASRLPAAFWGGTTPSGATILKMTWNAKERRWSCPSVFLSHAALGLRAEEEIDGLAVDRRKHFLLFSTKTPGRSQILFFNYVSDVAGPVPYSDPVGTPVASVIGLGNDDDIDAICASDPNSLGASLVLNPMAHFMGTPRPRQFLGRPAADVTVSAYRGTPGANFRTFLSGWPRSGRGGTAWLFVSQGNAISPLSLVAVMPRNTLDPVCGNPVSAQVPVPVDISVRGTLLSLRWFVAAPNTLALEEAFPVQIRL